MKVLRSIFRTFTDRTSGLSRRKNDRKCDILADNSGEAYIGEVVKILIAVVIGALVLGLLYALIQGLFPTITDKITELLNFDGSN